MKNNHLFCTTISSFAQKQIRMKMNIGFLRDEPFNSEQWITNVYKNENEIWICVMTQEAPVTCK